MDDAIFILRNNVKALMLLLVLLMSVPLRSYSNIFVLLILLACWDDHVFFALFCFLGCAQCNLSFPCRVDGVYDAFCIGSDFSDVYDALVVGATAVDDTTIFVQAYEQVSRLLDKMIDVLCWNNLFPVMCSLQ